MRRIRTGLGILICRAALAACTATGTKSPDTSVTAPRRRHPVALGFRPGRAVP